MPKPFRVSVPIACMLFLFAIPMLYAQSNNSAPSALNATGRNDGITINVTRPVAAKPKLLRVIFQFKAEDATSEKAIDKLTSHMKSIQTALTELGAIESSIEFAEIETNPSNAFSNANTVAHGPVGWAMNGVQNVFQAVQIAPPQIAVQAMPAIRLGQPVQRGEPSKALPAIVVVSSAVSVDWNIEGKSPIEIATLKPKLLAAIAKGNLDGKELFQKFTPEQEDEIFEITKIDIRNGDSRSMFSTAMPSPRTLFVGFLPESDSAAAMKSAFQSADKMASQLATAGNLKLGKIESVHVQVSTRSISANSSFPVPSYQAYPSNSTNLSIGSLVDWEPTIPTGEIRMDSLNQLKQNLNLSVRYRIE